jgi:chemotaxis protein CheX
MPAEYPLPARLEGISLAPVKTALLSLRGADLDVSGAAVERLNGMGVQLLMSAFQTWRDDGRNLRLVDPSPCLLDVFTRLGIEASLEGIAA